MVTVFEGRKMAMTCAKMAKQSVVQIAMSDSHLFLDHPRRLDPGCLVGVCMSVRFRNVLVPLVTVFPNVKLARPGATAHHVRHHRTYCNHA